MYKRYYADELLELMTVLAKGYIVENMAEFGEREKMTVINAFKKTKLHDLGRKNDYTTEDFINDYKGRANIRGDVEKLFKAARARELEILDENIRACKEDNLTLGIWICVKTALEKFTEDNVGFGILKPNSNRENNNALSIHIKEAIMSKRILEQLGLTGAVLHDDIKAVYLSEMERILAGKTGALDIDIYGEKEVKQKIDFLRIAADFYDSWRVSSAEEMILCRYIGAMRKFIQMTILVDMFKENEEKAFETIRELPF